MSHATRAKIRKLPEHDTVAHLEDNYDQIVAIHELFADIVQNGDVSSQLIAAEEELWSIASTKYNCVEKTASSAQPTQRRAVRDANLACQNYLDQFRNYVIIFTLPA